MRRLGVYGGTFDPPHRAHLAVALAARTALDLDWLWLVPCGLPPLKSAASAGPEHRLAMCELLIAGAERLGVDSRELRRAGPSYTVETLAELSTEQPGASWWLILGSDALADFPRWRRPERILELARLGVVERPSHPLDPLLRRLGPAVAERVDRLPASLLPYSSSGVREALGRGTRPVGELTPEVAAHVAKHRLYRDA